MSVQTILNLGDDQLSAKFFLIFPNGIPGGGDAESIALRMDQSFDLPEINVGEYEIAYKGMKIKKTSMTDNTDKTFTLQVRIDQQWKVFDDLYNLAKLTYDPNNGTAMPDASTRFPLAVSMVDGQDNIVKTWTFQGSKMKSFKIQTLDQSSDDPLRVELGFIYASHKVE